MRVKGRLHIAIVLITVMVCMSIMSIFPSTLFTRDVYADRNMILSLTASDTSVNPGDIVTINVFANQLDHITRFGPIDLRFSSDKAEFVSIWQPTELSSFVYTTDDSNPGHLVVSAVNEVVEADIAAGEDTSPYYESDIVLFSASFRMTSDATGGIRFWIDTADGFRDSAGVEFSSAIGDGLTVNVSGTVSDDASLMDLSITGAALTPSFDSDVYEYTTTVDNSIGTVEVLATPRNSGSIINVSGNTYLVAGENVVVVDVLAEDGITTAQYKIFVTRQGTTFDEGIILTDYDGRSYTCVAAPAAYDLPEGFEASVRAINGYDVPVFIKEGVVSYLVYLSAGDGEPAFYFYNPTTRVITRYNRDNYAIISSRILNVVPIPSDIKIPDGFREDSITTNEGVVLQGYSNAEGVFIAYMQDEAGATAFYRYDAESGQFVDYKTVDRTAERIYGLFFRIFMVISLIESLIIIGTVYLVRRIIANKNNPRPRRV